MKRETVERIVNSIITKSLKEKSNIEETIRELEVRSNNVLKVLDNRNIDISPLFDIIISGDESQIDKINVSKYAIYVYYFVSYSSKRTNDLRWMANNTDRFKKYSLQDFYNLILFRDKISKENSIYLPF
jgi:hypothetical protein